MWFGVAITAATVLCLVVRGPRSRDLAADDAVDEFELESAGV